MAITIRKIETGEAEIVIPLFDKYRIFYKQPSDVLIAERFIKERLHNNESVIFVAFINNEPAGFTQLYPTYSSLRVSKNWILNDLYVEEKFRKQGIGEKLIREAMQFAKDGGAAFVDLSTATDNYNAQRLYEAIGFKKKTADDSFFDFRVQL